MKLINARGVIEFGDEKIESPTKHQKEILPEIRGGIESISTKLKDCQNYVFFEPHITVDMNTKDDIGSTVISFVALPCTTCKIRRNLCSQKNPCQALQILHLSPLVAMPSPNCLVEEPFPLDLSSHCHLCRSY